VSTPEPLTGVRKAAIMLMAIGEAHAAALFKFLQEDEIESLAREIASLGGVPTALGERVLTEVHQMTVATEYIAAGGVDHARRLLTATLGPESARRILDRVMKSFTKNAGFTTLEKANSQQLGKFMLGEHPQTIALILAHLNAGSGAQLVAQLPEDMRADVLMRMATLEEISPEVISRISTVIDQRLKSLGGPSREQRGGVRAVAELFNRLDRGVSRAALERIERDSSEMALQIRNFMFTFDDLSQIDDAGIREIVNRADKKGLTAALKGATEEIRQRFFKNMSKRAGDMLKEEMELMGAVRLRDVEKAQQDIVGITRKLEEEGLITIGASAGEPYVV
jgi:flagellar motor switch protein FliG